MLCINEKLFVKFVKFIIYVEKHCFLQCFSLYKMLLTIAKSHPRSTFVQLQAIAQIKALP